MRVTGLALAVVVAAACGGAVSAAPRNPLIGSWAPSDVKNGACAAQVSFAAKSQSDVTVKGAAPITHPVQYSMSPGMVYATSGGGSTRWDVNKDGTITLHWPPFCVFHRVG